MDVSKDATLVTQTDFQQTVVVNRPEILVDMVSELFLVKNGTTLAVGFGSASNIGPTVSVSIDRRIIWLLIPEVADLTVNVLRDALQTTIESKASDPHLETDVKKLAESIEKCARYAREGEGSIIQ